MKSIPERTRAAIKDGISPNELQNFTSALRENMNACGTEATRSLSLFVVFFAGWILLRFSLIQKISVMGAEFANLQVVILLLPVIAAFFHYRYQCSVAMADMIDAALRQLYRHQFESLDKHDITELLAHPNFFTVENAMSNLESGKFSSLANIWAACLGIIFTFVPMIALIWCSYKLLVAPPLGVVASILCVIVIALLLIRTFLVFIQWMRALGIEAGD